MFVPMKLVLVPRCLSAAVLIACSLAAHGQEKATLVNAANFPRAETDRYFAAKVREGGFGRLIHARQPAAIDKQEVIRMNRDTLYSSGIFDLQAGPLTVTLPDAGKRFVSMQVISQDHYTTEVVYGPGRRTYNAAKVGTRYVMILVRTLMDPQNAQDIEEAHRVQDAIQVEQAAAGSFEVPQWDQASLNKARDALLQLGSLGGTREMFGAKGRVDPVDHLIGSAIGWGGNPRSEALYASTYPRENDGRTVHRLTVHDVPVDGFWSISVYNAKGYFEK